jgi:hypothetical protein
MQKLNENNFSLEIAFFTVHQTQARDRGRGKSKLWQSPEEYFKIMAVLVIAT